VWRVLDYRELCLERTLHLGTRKNNWTLSPRALSAAIAVCAPIALAILTHRGFLNVWFWTDDFVWLQAARNADLRSALRDAFTLPDGPTPYFRPLVDFYFFCMYRVVGTNALAYQVANLTLFSATGALLGLLALRLTRSAVTAGIAGALFVVSPSYGSLVAWPSGATAIISAFFSMTALLLFVAWLQGQRRPWILGLAVVSFAGSLLAKEEASALPPVLLLAALFISRPRTGRDLRAIGLALAPFVLVWIAYLLPQFILSIGSGNDKYSFGWHGVHRLIDSMVWLSLPWESYVGDWVSPASWAAFAFFTSAAAIAVLRRQWLLPGLYVSTVLMLAPSAFLNLSFAQRWTYLATLPWAFFVAVLATDGYQWLAARQRAVGLAVAVPVSAAVVALLAGRSIDSQNQEHIHDFAGNYHRIERLLASNCPELASGGNVYVLPLRLGAYTYAVPAEVHLFFPKAQVFMTKPQDLAEASLPPGGCTLYWTREAGFQAVPLPPTDPSLKFLAPS
jgi:hypothetical protein